jgi:putative redox protein
VAAGCLRGVGSSAGDFSLDGWLDDLRAIVDHCSQLVPDGGVWVVGFGTGGALGLCAASDDDRVRGAGCFGSPATFDHWVRDTASMVSFARRVGVIRSARFPPDLRAWSAPFTALRPLEAAARLTPRPLLVVHGSDDEEVPLSEGRRLAEAGGARAELRVLLGAGHRLRADPRAVAILTGWLERQGP